MSIDIFAQAMPAHVTLFQCHAVTTKLKLALHSKMRISCRMLAEIPKWMCVARFLPEVLQHQSLYAFECNCRASRAECKGSKIQMAITVCCATTFERDNAQNCENILCGSVCTGHFRRFRYTYVLQIDDNCLGVSSTCTERRP